MDTKIDFLYLSEPDMIKAGVKDMAKCVDCMEDLLLTLNKGDYMMGGENHNSHGCMIMFPDDPKFPGMPKNGPDRRFMAMPAYLGGSHQLAGMKWYGSNIENKEKGLPRSILMMMLNDKDTGAPIAMMSANLISSYRTGGIPGVGARYLARKDSKVVSIIGPGVMGKTSLAAFMAVCPNLETLKIKGRGSKSIENFKAWAKAEYPQLKEIIICKDNEEAVRDSDIVSFTTTVLNDVSTFPEIKEEWIKKVLLYQCLQRQDLTTVNLLQNVQKWLLTTTHYMRHGKKNILILHMTQYASLVHCSQILYMKDLQNVKILSTSLTLSQESMSEGKAMMRSSSSL